MERVGARVLRNPVCEREGVTGFTLEARRLGTELWCAGIKGVCADMGVCCAGGTGEREGEDEAEDDVDVSEEDSDDEEIDKVDKGDVAVNAGLRAGDGEGGGAFHDEEASGRWTGTVLRLEEMWGLPARDAAEALGSGLRLRGRSGVRMELRVGNGDLGLR